MCVSASALKVQRGRQVYPSSSPSSNLYWWEYSFKWANMSPQSFFLFTCVAHTLGWASLDLAILLSPYCWNYNCTTMLNALFLLKWGFIM